MSSNLKVNTILPSTGTAIGIGTASGNVDVLGHIVGHNTPNISGINSVTASHFYGNGSGLTGVSGVSVANQANNRLITATGTTDALTGETNLQWDGETLYINRSSNSIEGLSISNSNNSQGSAGAQLNLSGGDNSYANIRLECNGTSHHIRQDGSGNLKFYNNTTERLRISSAGQTLINTSAVTNTHDYLTVKRPASGFGEMSMTVDANTSTGSAANAFIFTKSKHTYWNGYGFQSSHGHIGAIVGKRDSAGTSDQEIRIEIGGTHINQSEERTWTFRNGGNFAVSDGNIELASGHGIDFSATANSSGSMGNELFSDYEQGSWSPTLTSGTATWYNQQWYTKIGRIVTAYFYMYNFSDTSSSTHVRINGLPYANNNARESSFHISTGGNPSLGSGSIGVFGRIGVTGNTTQITLYRGFATTTASMTHAQLNSGHYYATFQYATDA